MKIALRLGAALALVGLVCGCGANYCWRPAVPAAMRTVAVPTGVYATDGTSATGVTVSWFEVVGASGYTVYRNTVNNPDAAEVVS